MLGRFEPQDLLLVYPPKKGRCVISSHKDSVGDKIMKKSLQTFHKNGFSSFTHIRDFSHSESDTHFLNSPLTYVRLV